MASIGFVNADVPDTVEQSQTSLRPKKIFFGVFFDGTGNNMIQKSAAANFKKKQQQQARKEARAAWGQSHTMKEAAAKSREASERGQMWETQLNDSLNRRYGSNATDGQPKEGSDYSNVAYLHSVYKAMSAAQYQQLRRDSDVWRYNIYVEGAGKDELNDNTFLQDAANAKGSGFGGGATGVTALVSKAVAMVMTMLAGFKLNSDDELHFDVVGFSRGAACARLFAHLVARDDGQPLPTEKDFGRFMAKGYYKNGFLKFLNEFDARRSVDFLGIYDTVSSVGLTYDGNVDDYGLYSPAEARVLHTFHLCAMDEFRNHFGLTGIGDAARKGDNAEIFIPGCHSDVGGGYISGDETFILDYPLRMFTSSPNSPVGTRETLDGKAEVLRRLGWFDPDKEGYDLTDHNLRHYVEVTRRVKGGYGRIPLQMMAERARTFAKREMFDAGQQRLAVNTGDKILADLSGRMLAMARTQKGRRWFYPDGDGDYCYRNLRTAYLHFTSTDRILSLHSAIVHGYSMMGDTICRYLYKGNRGDQTRTFVCNYD